MFATLTLTASPSVVKERAVSSRPPALESEEQLVLAAQRDPAAFAGLYDRYVDKIYAFAYHRTNQVEDAEDITARTFEKALANIGRYEWRGAPFGAWLYRIASNLIAESYRGRPPTTDLEDAVALPTHDQGPEDSALDREEIAALHLCIKRLPPDYQAVLALKFGQQLRNKEIGDVIGRSEGAIKALMHRAVGALREELRKEGVSG